MMKSGKSFVSICCVSFLIFRIRCGETLYVFFESVSSSQLHYSEIVPEMKLAWRTPSSRTRKTQIINSTLNNNAMKLLISESIT